MKFFFLSTDHLVDRILFKDDDDFRVAMNYVALAAYLTGVNVLSFILMSNHVHFVLECSRDGAEAFINRFKMLYGRHYCRKYNCKDFLRRIKVDIRELKIEDESLFRGIAYVQMNCVAANICAHPSMYPWGSGAVFFNRNKLPSKRVGDYSDRTMIKLLKTKVKLPDDYIICDEGYILPQSFVRVQFVESLFRTPKRYDYFLNTSSKARARMEKSAAPSFSDQLILGGVKNLCNSLYRVGSYSELQDSMRAEVIKYLSVHFKADVNQIARVLGESYSDIVKMLEDF